MNRQWVIGIAAVIVIAAFVAWVAKNTYWEEITIPAGLQGEAARNPFYAAERLTGELGGTSEWRRTLGEMPDPNTVLVLVRWHWDLIDSRRARLERWVESGGRLVLVGNLTGGHGALEEWSGLAKARDAGDAAAAGDTGYEAQAGVPPFVSAPGRPCGTVHVVAGRSQANPSRTEYSVCGLDTGRLVSEREAEWALADSAQPDQDLLQAVRVPAGRGSVAWINASSYGYTQPFSNLTLLDEDHGVLFVDTLRLHHGDHVVFVSAEESASLLELIWTYGAPAVVLSLALVGVALRRNAARFGPLAAALDASRRSLAEQIRGTARFVLRVGRGEGLHAAMVRALHEAARRRIPGYERKSLRDRASAISGLAGVDADKLSDAMQPERHRASHELRTTVALLDAARRKLT